MENLIWLGIIVLVFINFIWGLWFLGNMLKFDNIIKPYNGSFKVKHLSIVFVLPSYLLHLVIIFVGFLIVKAFEVCSDPVTKIGKFLNKPLFSKEEK